MSPAARLRLFYFLYYGSIGASLPYLAPYLRGLGFSGAEIGAVQMVGPLVAGPAALRCALAADRLAAPAWARRLATLWALAAMAFLPIARAPSVVAAVAGYALTARRLPAPPAPEVRPALRDLRSLVRDPRLLLLLGASALHWAGCAPFHLFYGVFVRDLGLPSTLTGLGMAVGVGAEVLVLLAFPRLRRRFSLRALFAAAFAATALRWWLLSRSGAAAAVVGLQSVHGLTFGLFWGAAVEAMSGLVPARLRATGQALFGAVVFGAGNALGFELSGLGYDHYRGAAPLYAWAAALEIVPLLAAGLASAFAAGPGAAAGGGVGAPGPSR